MERRLTTFKKKSLQNFSSSKAIEEYEMTALSPVEKTIVKDYSTRKNTNVLDMISLRMCIIDGYNE